MATLKVKSAWVKEMKKSDAKDEKKEKKIPFVQKQMS